MYTNELPEQPANRQIHTADAMEWTTDVAGKAFETCGLCPRQCRAVRREVRGEGFCGCGVMPVVAGASLHMWEEPIISGTAGSGTIFFSGCTLRCVFCQNYAIASSLRGQKLTAVQLAQTMRDLERQGAHNISFVTGTQYIPAIIEALHIYRPHIPLVWNSSGYERIEAVNALSKYIDIWLPDYKFALTEPAKKYAHAPDYPETAMEAIKLMCRLSGEAVMENGVMQHGVIVRHLVLPGNLRNSVAALRRLAAELPEGTPVSVMSQYIPSGDIDAFPELQRRLTEREYQKICLTAEQLGLNGFMQELSSASEAYIPDFDLTPLDEA